LGYSGIGYDNERVVPVTSHAYQYMLTRLKQARKAAGLTQVQAGGILGVRQTVISKIEKGERKIDPIELALLAQAYGKSIDHFVETVVASQATE